MNKYSSTYVYQARLLPTGMDVMEPRPSQLSVSGRSCGIQPFTMAVQYIISGRSPFRTPFLSGRLRNLHDHRRITLQAVIVVPEKELSAQRSKDRIG